MVSAVVVGPSFGNLWICTLLVFSLRAGGRSLAAGYILGRAAALVALSLAVSLAGYGVHVPARYLNVASGAFLLCFAAYPVATRVLDWVPPWRSRPETQDLPGTLRCGTTTSRST